MMKRKTRCASWIASKASGRVYYNLESSNKWHKGYGAGLWFAWLDRANTLSVSYARSEGHNGIYARAGFAF